MESTLGGMKSAERVIFTVVSQFFGQLVWLPVEHLYFIYIDISIYWGGHVELGHCSPEKHILVYFCRF